MTENAASVRLKIEAAKAAVMDLQENGALGSESLALSVDVLRELDKAWLAACHLQHKRSYGQ